MVTPAITPRLSAIHCAPSIPEPLPVFTSLPSLTSSISPLSLSLKPAILLVGVRRHRHGLELTGDATVSSRLHYLASPLPLILAHPLMPFVLFSRSQSTTRLSPHLAGARSSSGRTPTPTRAAPDHDVVTIVFATPSRTSSLTRRHRRPTGAPRRRNPEPSPTTTTPLPATRGELPLSLPCLISAQRVAARGPAAPASPLSHADVVPVVSAAVKFV